MIGLGSDKNADKEICHFYEEVDEKWIRERAAELWIILQIRPVWQGCIFRLTCSHRELTKNHVLTSAYVKIFRSVTRKAVNKSVWKIKDCSWLPLNKHAMNIFIQTSTNVSLSTVLKEPEHSSLRIRAHLSWMLENRKHLHVLNVLELTPRAPIPDGRMEQIMQPWRLGIFWIRNRAEMNIFTNQRYALRISQVRIHKRLFPWYYSINISASKLRNMCNPQIGYLLEKTEN